MLEHVHERLKKKLDLLDLNGLIVIINRNLLDLRKGFE